MRSTEVERFRASQTAILGMTVGGLIALRLVDVFRYRIDTDEPQHLHVIWGWTRGLLQYRDVFDNHAPLFHLLYAPILALVGERADVVPAMRLTVLPLYALAVGCTYAIAAPLFSRRAALWAAVLTAFYGGFFFTSLEFRTDDLWAPLWLLAVATLVRGRLTAVRCLVAGLLLGAALGTSLKTVMLLASVALAAVGAVVLVGARGTARPRLRDLATSGAALVAGMVVVPALLVGFFASRDALPAMYYGTVAHNVLPGLGLWHSEHLRALALPLALPLLWTGGRRIARLGPAAPVARRRVFVFLVAGLYLALLFGAWPLITHEDFPPVDPLVVLLATGLVLTAPSIATASAGWRTGLAFALPMAAVLLEGAILVYDAPPWKDATRDQASVLGAVLRLTAPGDYVMDVKGETIFRPRPFFYALEHITKARLDRGLIVDDVPERLVATHTAVAVLDGSSLPPHARAFLNANYLPVGPVRVLGHVLPPDAGDVHFEVAVPTEYAIVSERGAAHGLLDGSPYDGPRFLAEGEHEFAPADPSSRLALVWEPALARGFSPFAAPRKEIHAAAG